MAELPDIGWSLADRRALGYAMSMRERIRQWPLHWVFVYYAVAFGVLSLLADLLFGVWGGPGWAILGGVVFASIMTPVAWRQRKRESGA